MNANKKEILDWIKKSKWHKFVNRKSDVLIADLLMKSSGNPEYFKKYYGATHGVHNYLYYDGNWCSNEIYYGLERELFEKAKKDSLFLRKALEKGEKEGKNLLKWGEIVRKKNFENASKKELKKLFKTLVDKLCAFIPNLFITHIAEDYYHELIRKNLGEKIKDKKKIDNLMIKLTSPVRFNDTYYEQLSILKIAVKKKEGKNIEKDIEKHIDKFGILGMTWGHGKIWDKKDVKKRLKNINNPEKKLKELENKKEKTEEEFKKVVKKYGFDKKFIEQLKTARDYVWFRTFRNNAFNYAYNYSLGFIKELGKHMVLKEYEIKNMTSGEIIDEEIPSKKELAERKKDFVYVLKNNEVYVFSGKDKNFILDYFKKMKNRRKDVVGVVANGPVEKVSGVAKIVSDVNELSKVKIGDILVANMTTPNFITAMEKASAFVTDEGGILCHAAIVSREMGKPCIIGTNIATEVFKDGDYIELDLVEGVVKKITKKKHKKEIKELEEKEKAVEVSEIPEEKRELDLGPEDILWFKDISKKDIEIVGGKGANLGEMFSKFPIPNGFCVTVNAYKKFLKENDLEKKIFSKLKNLDIEDTEKLEKTTKKIRELIVKGSMPEDVKNDIINNYNKLNEKFVAVRSSATAEDLPTASFAGQQATYLNVKGEKDVIKYVKDCWASLFTARATYYRVINKFKHEKVLISVVIQEMVNSKTAGVMFTVNPVNNDRKEMIIEGSWGLGEAVVSGQVTPDGYILSKKGPEIKQKMINEKRMAIIKDEKTGKNKTLNLKGDKAIQECMKDEEVLKLAEIGKKIEEHYKHPQDIEWAINQKGKIFILQSRAITTL